MSPPKNAPSKPRRDRDAAQRRSGGRSARIKRRAASAVAAPVALVRRTPPYDLLDEESLDALERQADWILHRIGVEIRDAESLALLRRAGASVDGSRARFEPGLARALCATAPRQFTMHARRSQGVARSIVIGGAHVVFVPAYGPPFVRDLDRGRRYATIDDFRNFVRLTHATPWLQHSGGTVCEPVDIAVNKRHLDMVFAHLRYSAKPFMGAVTAPQRAQDSIDMARIVFGDDFMRTHCVIQGNINVNSPLVFDHTMLGALKVYARANQGVVLSPFILGGAMGPVTQAALVAQAHAETLVGVALTQLVCAGAPVVYGNFLTTIDLQTGAPTFGTPGANLATFAIGQLCRRLGLPLRCGGHLTASKVADGQAMQESADTMTAGLLAGANFVLQSAGWLEGGLTIGYEKFMIDIDRCAMMHRALAGLEIDDNALAQDAYQEAGPGGNFLATAHTMANFETANHRSDLADNRSFEHWQEDGATTIEQRAHASWKNALAEYEMPPMDAGVEEELVEFVERKKGAVEDEWY
ncbi:MAG: trimethylamine methyltransferase family protein [bacterium]